ncbi:hypothetical protein H5410_043404 [Solanum commersonii]|uniref:Uncharacterized protein n=1 Tax=Solanum commersonii TaxID=4109 RepID=A0A9J5XYR8_SOLCO|nr:hypothetical protein H5410_043404 [Solanum commersonii]
MASRCSRIINKASISSIRSAIKLNSQSASSTTFVFQFLCFNQICFVSSPPVILFKNSVGAGRSAVNVATTQCSCYGEDDVMPELNIEELQSSFTGYTLLHLSRPLACSFITTTK